LDLMFYAATGLIAAVTLIRINGGSPRIYALAGITAGIIAYIKTISALIGFIIAKAKAHKRKNSLSKTLY